MFKRLALCLVLVGAPQFAAAQSFQDQIIGQLRAQGFTEISINQTWLGRIRVTAVRSDLRRELVFNPQTGEILRDFWRTSDDDDNRAPRLFNPGGGSAPIGQTADDGDDEDDAADDRNDDNDDNNDDGDDDNDDDSGSDDDDDDDD